MATSNRLGAKESDNKNIVSGGPQLLGPYHLSFSEYLLRRLESGGNKVAQIHGITGATSSYGEILQKSVNLAEGLRKLGVNKGDVIAISCENRFEFTVCAIAVMFVGAVNAPINTMYLKDELHNILRIAKPKMVFVSSSTIQSLKDVKTLISSIEKLINIDSDRSDADVGILAYKDLVKNHVDLSSYEVVKVGIHDPLVILCSSGTTGMPKGVVITHHNVSVCNDILGFGIGRHQPVTQHCLISIVPWFHAYGFLTQLMALNFHLRYVYLHGFEAVTFLNAIQQYKVTLSFLVPPLMVFLAKHPLVDKYDLSSLTEIWCAAAPLSEELELAVKKRIGNIRILQGYGLTESTMGVTHNSMSDKSKSGSSGTCVPGVKIKIVDLETGEALGPNKPGEVWIKGPIIMAGYLGDETSTQLTVDRDGWLHSGDIAYYDEEGFFFIVDRLKELIKYKAYQVPPAELEAIILQNPGIKDCGVVGLPDEAAGELPLAFVVLQPGSTLTEDQIKDFVAQRVSYQKRLHGGVRFLEEIPKNPSGKILKKELRKMLTFSKKSKF